MGGVKYPRPILRKRGSRMERPLTDNERIDRIINGLGCSIAEAKEILKCDKLIDLGHNPFPQTEEQKAATKKYSGTGTKKHTVYKLETREKKPNSVKRCLMEKVENLFREYKDFEVINPERQLRFTYEGKTYEVTVTEKRGKRGG